MSEQSEIKPWEKFITCPHCQERVAITVSLDLNSPRPTTHVEHPAATALDVFTTQEQAILRTAEDTGLLTAYVTAYNFHNPQGTLTEKTKYRSLLLFFKLAAAKRVPQFVVMSFNAEFGGRLFFHAANGVVSVTSDGKIRAFVPQRVVAGERVGKMGGGSGIATRMPADEATFHQWVRTKNGYVVGRGLFFDELQKKSRGEFVSVNL